MNNSNDNIENFSDNTCNPGPSTAADSSVNESLTTEVNDAPTNKERKNFSKTSLLLSTDQINDAEVKEGIRSNSNATEVVEIVENITSIAIDNQHGSSSNNQRETETINQHISHTTQYVIPSHHQDSNQSCPTTTATSAQRCYRALSEQVVSDTEISIAPLPFQPYVIRGPPPLSGAPPSYSAVMRIGPVDPTVRNRRDRIQPSPPFVAPIPPPSYAEVEGYYTERPMIVASVDQGMWGPDPLSVICPRCANVVVTSTHSQRSNLTHFSAIALCLCGCWPCCLLPYCMDSCKNTYHHCPNCQQFLGMYRPW